jgi:hypothetical protein
VKIDEALHLRFVPETQVTAELTRKSRFPPTGDEIPYTGLTFDLGEAVAQSLLWRSIPLPKAAGRQGPRRSQPRR